MSAEKKVTADETRLEEEESVKSKGKAPVFIKSPQEKHLVRKINWTFMPLVCLILFVQFIDKGTLTIAAVFGLYEDTHITQTQYSWVSSIFYLGFLIVQAPNQYFLQRVQISKYLGSILIIWGVCLACTAVAKDFGQLAGLRFLLGFFEGTTYPCIFLLISTLYRRSEQVIWFGVMFITNALAIAVGSLVGFGIGLHMDGAGGMRAWKWGMIIFGAITVAIGFIFFCFLPDKAKSRWFHLTPEEEKIVEERTLDNAAIQNKDVKIGHIFESLREIRFYFYFLISFFLNMSNGAITAYATQLIQDLGFSALNAVLLLIPFGVVIMVLVGIAVFVSRQFDNVNIVAAVFSLVGMVGCIILAALPGGRVKLIGLYLSSVSPSYVLLQTSISSNVSGYTKKIFYTGLNMVAFCLGNFVGPLILLEREAPRYISGMSTYAAVDFVVAILFGYLALSYNRLNRQRQSLKNAGRIEPRPTNFEELDMTDKEDLNFNYRP